MVSFDIRIGGNKGSTGWDITFELLLGLRASIPLTKYCDDLEHTGPLKTFSSQ